MKKRDVKALIHDKGLEREINIVSIGGIDRLVLNGVATAIRDWQSVYDFVVQLPAKKIVPLGLSDKELAAYIPKGLQEHIDIERR